jgi:steroid delta-isomerase-like uncharacterized protein
MSIETNKTLVKRFLSECWDWSQSGEPNFALVDELMTPDVLWYDDPFFPEGRRGTEAVKRVIASVCSLVPDLWLRIEDIVAEGDKVAVRWTIGGTQKGEWEEGIPPTGKQIKWTGIEIYRIMNGRITEERTLEDGLTYLYQMQVLQTWKPPNESKQP